LDNIEEILDGCRLQERQSQEKLYKQFYPILFALCKNFFDDKHDIVTAVNNGMLRVFKNLDQYDSKKGEFFNWVYTIVRNSALTMIRDRQTSKIEFDDLDDKMVAISQINPFEELEYNDIHTCMKYLPLATRRICSLYYLDGLSSKEISELLAISSGTVKWHLSESRSRLAVIFKKIL
jgi:RNA polymerase sigma factor (sigma-70 family)